MDPKLIETAMTDPAPPSVAQAAESEQEAQNAEIHTAIDTSQMDYDRWTDR